MTGSGQKKTAEEKRKRPPSEDRKTPAEYGTGRQVKTGRIWYRKTGEDRQNWYKKTGEDRQKMV